MTVTQLPPRSSRRDPLDELVEAVAVELMHIARVAHYVADLGGAGVAGSHSAELLQAGRSIESLAGRIYTRIYETKMPA